MVANPQVFFFRKPGMLVELKCLSVVRMEGFIMMERQHLQAWIISSIVFLGLVVLMSLPQVRFCQSRWGPDSS